MNQKTKACREIYPNGTLTFSEDETDNQGLINPLVHDHKIDHIKEQILSLAHELLREQLLLRNLRPRRLSIHMDAFGRSGLTVTLQGSHDIWGTDYWDFLAALEGPCKKGKNTLVYDLITASNLRTQLLRETVTL
ncbi:MAG: hypothetical protein WC647_04045 [Desulfomonilaceae bacterium]|jgi:hypothetical protein